MNRPNRRELACSGSSGMIAALKSVRPKGGGKGDGSWHSHVRPGARRRRGAGPNPVPTKPDTRMPHADPQFERRRGDTRLSVKAISEPVHGFDVCGLISIRLDFLAHRGDVSIDRARDDVLLDSPDIAQQLFPGDGAAAVLNKVAQDIELECRKGHGAIGV